MDSEYDTSSSDESSCEVSNSGRKACGLLKSYHGIAYQLQWIMVVALNSQKVSADCGFKFRTEDEERNAGKFDDVVWQYRDGQEKKYNFLQSKHKLDSQVKITMADLIKSDDLKRKDNPFSLQKYFVSYKNNIKDQNCHEMNKYKDGIIENLVIATNVDFDGNLKQSLESIQIKNPILKALQEKKDYIQYWKINKSSIPDEIKIKLEETYDLIKLVKKLGEHVRSQQPFILPPDLKLYNTALRNNIVDETGSRLSENFIQGKNLSKEAKYLRQALLQEEFEKKRATFNLLSPKAIRDPTEIAKVLSTLLMKCNNKIVKITKRSKVIKENIDALSGYVLVEDDGIKFNYKFWLDSDDKLPNESIKLFKGCLIEYLKINRFINPEDSSFAIAQKFESYRFDINNFKTCRKELVDETSFWEAVRSFDKFQFYATTENINKEEKGLPDYCLDDIEKVISSFFDLLIFAVNCSKNQLNSYIGKELKENFEFTNNELIADAFRSNIAKSLDLSEKGYISSYEEVSQFFKTVKKQINVFVLHGLTLEYQIKLNSLGAKFADQYVNKFQLRSFLSHKANEQLLLLKAVHVRLSSIKVLQKLKLLSKFKTRNKYIFMQINTLLNDSIQNLVIESFKNKSTLSIIEFNTSIISSDFDLDKLYQKILSILNLNRRKKIIIIASENNMLAEKFKSNIPKYKEILDKYNNITHLTKKSRDNILKKAIALFQGKKGNLTTLLNRNVQLVNNEVLFKVITGDEIQIGAKAADLGQINEYYIPRTFAKRVVVKKSVLNENDSFALSNMNQFELEGEYKNGNITILKGENVEEEFSFFCSNFPKNTIHWLQYKNSDWYTWQKSQGPLKNIREHLCDDTIYYEETDSKFLDEIKSKKMFILSAEPGMGKSTVTTKLASSLKDVYNDYWIIRVDLRSYSTDFKRNIDSKFLIEFLYKVANLNCFNSDDKSHRLKEIMDNVNMQQYEIVSEPNKNVKYNLFEVEVLNLLYNEGKVIMFLDGFDEICSMYESKVLQLIDILKNSRVAKLFITTRTYNILHYLEDLVSEFTYSLKSFSLSDQTKFLILYWQSKLKPRHKFDEDRAILFIGQLIHDFSRVTNDPERTFVSIPLQLRMLADNFKNMFFEFYNSTVRDINNLYKKKIREQLDLLSLYQNFIRIKFEKIRFQEKKPGSNPDDADMQQVMKREYEIFINDHRKLAVYTLFRNDDLINVLNTEDEIYIEKTLLNNIKNADEKNGIIHGVRNGQPIFVHQTFAEYFASSYFWEIFKTSELLEFKNNFIQDIILNYLFTGKYVQTCNFFYVIARSELKEKTRFKFMAEKITFLLECLVNKIRNIYTTYENGGDTRCRGTDNLFEPGYVPGIRLLFKIIECFLQQHGSEIKGITEIVRQDTTTDLLKMASECGCLKFTKLFLEIHSDKNKYENDLKTTKWCFTPLWLSFMKKHVEVYTILVKVYNRNYIDVDGLSLVDRLNQANASKLQIDESIENINNFSAPMVTSKGHPKSKAMHEMDKGERIEFENINRETNNAAPSSNAGKRKRKGSDLNIQNDEHMIP